MLFNLGKDTTEHDKETEKRRFRINLFVTSAIILLLWYVKLLEISLDTSFVRFGVYPRTWHGLKGILFAPFIHSGFSHLINNTVPLFLFSLSVLYFYKNIGYRVLLSSYLASGILVWIGARASFHIGASGVVYALAAFLFFSGIIRRNTNLLAIALIITFMYGSMVWGIFPIDLKISWESHLYGGFIGAVLAVIFRKHGPKPPKKYWEDEEDDDVLDDEDAYWRKTHENS
jgi:membrane associated rhomboid family serine protease